MQNQCAYIALGIVILLIVAIIAIVNRKGAHRPFSSLVGLALAFIAASIVFSDDKFISYGLIGAGMILTIIDIIKSRKLNN